MITTNVATVGQDQKTIDDPTRLFHCGVCRYPLSVRDLAPPDPIDHFFQMFLTLDVAGFLHLRQIANEDPSVLIMFDFGAQCPSCSNLLCIYCGCADTAPCLRKEYGIGQAGACSWKVPGLCDFCYEQLAASLYAQVNEMLPKPFTEPTRPELIHR